MKLDDHIDTELASMQAQALEQIKFAFYRFAMWLSLITVIAVVVLW